MARARGDVRTAVDELLVLTDTWYADVEAWLELADIYADCALYVLLYYRSLLNSCACHQTKS
jgi:hypothetical protein